MTIQSQRVSEAISSGASTLMAVATLVLPFGLHLGIGLNFLQDAQDYWSWVVGLSFIAQLAPLENVAAYRGNNHHKDMITSWFTLVAASIDVVVYLTYCVATGQWSMPAHWAFTIWGGSLIAGIADAMLVIWMKRFANAA